MNTIEGGIKGKRRGLTLIEMVMVLVIIGIMAKITLPNFNINRYRADGAGRLARVILQEAERNAITRQSNVIVSLDANYNRFRVVQDYNNNDTINTTDLVTWRNMGEGAVFAKPAWAGAVGADSTTPTAAFAGAGLVTVSGLPTVIFLRSGSLSTNFYVYVTTRVNVPTEYREVICIASTGRCDLYKYNGKGWVRMTS